jgi:methylisocitrate lyase
MQVENLRSLMESDEPLLLPSAYNALTARLAESLGLDAVYLGGNLAGAMTTATEPMITMTEMADQAREIVHAVDIPLIIDGDAGFGDATHTYRTVEKFIKTGIAGTHIEDQVYPKRLHYHAGRHHITDIDEMCTKVEAAAQAREDTGEDIVLIARTDAARGHRREDYGETIEDAVDRVNTYLDAGADAGMLFPKDKKEIEYVANHVEGPQAIIFAEYREESRELTISDINDLGFDFVIYPLSAQLVTVKAMRGFYKSVLEDGSMTIGIDEGREIQDDIIELIDLPKYYDIEDTEGKR